MDYKHYSYKGYYIVEKVDEFDATTMENHNARIEDARKHWHFTKMGDFAFKTIQDITEYIDLHFQSMLTIDYKNSELQCLD